MANPGFGNFVGSFGQAFNRARLAKDESARRDEIAKLQAKLVEAQITAGNTVLDWRYRLYPCFISIRNRSLHPRGYDLNP